MAAAASMGESQGDGLLDRVRAEALARTLRAVADPTRIQVLSVIRSTPGGEVTGGELADRLRLTQPTISHHLALMVKDGLLARERRGKHVFFSVVPDRADALDDLLG